jgi:hypothetical protein
VAADVVFDALRPQPLGGGGLADVLVFLGH